MLYIFFAFRQSHNHTLLGNQNYTYLNKEQISNLILTGENGVCDCYNNMTIKIKCDFKIEQSIERT